MRSYVRAGRRRAALAATFLSLAGAVLVYAAFAGATTAPPASDAAASGVWSSGTSFTVTLSTSNPSDVIVLFVGAYKASTAITVSASSPHVTWRLRKASTVCSGTQETRLTYLYGIASSALTNEVVTITLSNVPTAAAAQAVAFSGVKTSSPFDPAVFPNFSSACKSTSTAPLSGSWSTVNADDTVIGMYEGYTSTNESAGLVAGSTGTLALPPRAATGTSLAIEYRQLAAANSKKTAAFAANTTYWGLVTDALTAG